MKKEFYDTVSKLMFSLVFLGLAMFLLIFSFTDFLCGYACAWWNFICELALGGCYVQLWFAQFIIRIGAIILFALSIWLFMRKSVK